jgi:transcriptional regulator with XRE-family HTH domain
MPTIHDHSTFFGISSLHAGEYITAKRKALGMTQAQLCEQVGIPNQPALAMYENGKNDWRSSRYAPAIIDALRITKKECIEDLGIRILIDYRDPRGLN